MGSLWLATAVAVEASLAFIGLGVAPPTPTWGGMVREGFEHILDSFSLVLVPTRGRSSCVVFALNLLGDGLRDAIDPKMRGESRRPRPRARLLGVEAPDAFSFGMDGVAAARRWTSDLSFIHRPRETVAVVGESGSGKSVTALSIMRLLPAFHRIEGQHPARAASDLLALPGSECVTSAAAAIGMIFQEPMTSLNPVLTVGVQVGGGAAHGIAARPRGAPETEALRLFDRVRIPDAQRARPTTRTTLSGGMRQRVMIAMALACRPQLLIADEPTTALDVTIQAQILALIAELQRETGMAVLFITHDMGVVAEIADRIVVMRKGDEGRGRRRRRHLRAARASLYPERCWPPCPSSARCAARPCPAASQRRAGDTPPDRASRTGAARRSSRSTA